MLILTISLIVLSILVFSFTWTNLVGAPWAPTSMNLVHKMLKLAEVRPEDVVYDLGCGDGRIIIAAARRYGAQAVGFEIDPLRYLWCRMLIRILGLRDRVRVVFGNFFNKDLSEANVVTCYLLQSTNNKLEDKFEKELRPGTRVVSNTFTFSRWQTVREDGDARLYLANFGREERHKE